MRIRTIRRRDLNRYLAALAFVGVGTGLSELLYRLTGTTRLSMIFLTSVLVSAYLLGSGPAYFSACIAFLIYNFYLVEPRFSISLGSPEDLITLAVFFIAAMLTGNLTGRVRDEAKRATGRAITTAVLFEASRSFSAASDEALIRRELAGSLAKVGAGEAFIRNGAALITVPEAFTPDGLVLGCAVETARRAAEGESHTTRIDGWCYRPLSAGGGILGVAAWRDAPARPADEQPLIDILVDAAAAAIVRARLAAAKAEAETRARTEDLRNALLSSISHDLRTPLAAIMASASSLQDFGDSFAPAVRQDLASTIQDEAVRLDSFVANLLNMTRIEAGGVQVRSAPFSVVEVVERVVERLVRQRRGRVEANLPPNLVEAIGDPILFEQVLANVVENAIRYGGADRPVRVSAEAADGRVAVEVLDEGPGVPDEELDAIFRKFYRSPRTAQLPGAGLGLSIARGLMQAMGGEISARKRDDGRQGLVVRLEVGRCV